MRILSCQSVCSTTSKTELQGNQNLNDATEMLQRVWKSLKFLPGRVSEKPLCISFFSFEVMQEKVSDPEETGLKSATDHKKFHCLKLLSSPLCPFGPPQSTVEYFVTIVPQEDNNR